MGTGSSTNSDSTFPDCDDQEGGQLYISLKMENYKVKHDLIPHVYGSVPLVGSWDTTKAVCIYLHTCHTSFYVLILFVLVICLHVCVYVYMCVAVNATGVDLHVGIKFRGASESW